MGCTPSRKTVRASRSQSLKKDPNAEARDAAKARIPISNLPTVSSDYNILNSHMQEQHPGLKLSTPMNNPQLMAHIEAAQGKAQPPTPHPHQSGRPEQYLRQEMPMNPVFVAKPNEMMAFQTRNQAVQESKTEFEDFQDQSFPISSPFNPPEQDERLPIMTVKQEQTTFPSPSKPIISKEVQGMQPEISPLKADNSLSIASDRRLTIMPSSNCSEESTFEKLKISAEASQPEDFSTEEPKSKSVMIRNPSFLNTLKIEVLEGEKMIQSSSSSKTKLTYCCISRPGNEAFIQGSSQLYQNTNSGIIPELETDSSREGHVKENQDCFGVFEKVGSDENSFMMIVLDGHGANGGKCSKFVRDKLLLELEKNEIQEALATADSELGGIIHDSCVQVNKDLSKGEIDTFVSGTTAVFALIKEEALYVANIGDSRAVLGRMINPAEDDFATESLDLSCDHKPDRPDEEARIKSCGGRVFKWGVPRVWRGDQDIPGLAMSRSFGDMAAESVGVTAEPEITRTEIEEQDLFVILATDGIWEFISSEEAVEMVGNVYKKYFSPNERYQKSEAERCAEFAKESCIDLIRKSVKKWNENEEMVDDCTCCVIKLH